MRLARMEAEVKLIVIDRYGPPEEVARCVEAPDVGAPAAGEVVFDVLAFPINPADISFCRGTYRLKPTLPATPGAECVGRVTAVGSGVTRAMWPPTRYWSRKRSRLPSRSRCKGPRNSGGVLI